jgi:hypothetical protein
MSVSFVAPCGRYYGGVSYRLCLPITSCILLALALCATQAVIEAGVGQRLVELLTHHSPSVQTPALRTVGNIVTGNRLLLDSGTLQLVVD